MTQHDRDWAPLLAELDGWAAAGRAAPFWWRDDDAVAPGPALDRLLALTGAAGVPLTLAVIPEGTGPALATRLSGEDHAAVAVHGWSHVNHAPEGAKKQELGLHRPVAEVAAELRQGLAKLTALHGARALPLLVPPWNRIDAGIVAALPALGFHALSVFGAEAAGPPVQINTHVDLIDWRGNRGGRPVPALVAEIVARLRLVRDTGGAVGLLTHHLVHDTAAWDVLDALVSRTAHHPGCRWLPAATLLAAARAGHAG